MVCLKLLFACVRPFLGCELVTVTVTWLLSGARPVTVGAVLTFRRSRWWRVISSLSEAEWRSRSIQRPSPRSLCSGINEVRADEVTHTLVVLESHPGGAPGGRVRSTRVPGRPRVGSYGGTCVGVRTLSRVRGSGSRWTVTAVVPVRVEHRMRFRAGAVVMTGVVVRCAPVRIRVRGEHRVLAPTPAGARLAARSRETGSPDLAPGPRVTPAARLVLTGPVR